MSGIPQHEMYRLPNATYLGVRIYKVVSNHVSGEDAITYGQFETLDLAEQWIRDTWGDKSTAHVITALMATMRIDTATAQPAATDTEAGR